jgi:hypothetical protein
MNKPVLERRREVREHSETRLRVGYARGAWTPSESDLMDVECQDLSRSGCAFWTVGTPDHDELLVVFGEAPNLVRIKARVIHWHVAAHNDRLRTLVGCEFVERL